MAGYITNDTEAFIKSIKKRSALYLKSLKEYSDINLKKKLWDDVCFEVVSNWSELEPVNKRKIGIEVQKKWLNLRTCFSRELKAQQTKTGLAASKRRKYIYFEKLLFLKSSSARRRADGDLNSVDTGEEVMAADSNTDDELVQPPRAKIKINSNQNSRFKESVLNAPEDDLDEDKHFVLSLVTTLKSMTEDEKFQAKIEILKIFQRIKSNRTLAPPNNFV